MIKSHLVVRAESETCLRSAKDWKCWHTPPDEIINCHLEMQSERMCNILQSELYVSNTQNHPWAESTLLKRKIPRNYFPGRLCIIFY